MSVRRLLAAAGVLLALAGCSSSKPTQPLPETPLSSLVVNPTSDTLVVGGTGAFTVTAVDTSGALVPNPTVTWSSSNAGVFTVSSGGVVTAVGEGTATLQASSGGKTATAPLLVLATQRGWFAQVSNVSSDLRGVWFLPNGNSGWAVGAGGRIVFTSNAGNTWAQQTSNTSFDLNSVWFTSATEGWAAGANGTLVHTVNAGTTWSVEPSGTSDDLYGIVFATPDTGWAVGQNGTILRTFDRGVNWTRTSVTSTWLNAVSFAGTKDGWAVGDNGTIVGTHDRGLTWFVVQPSLTSNTLSGVWRSSVSAASVVGVDGTALITAVTPDSVAWQIGNGGASNDLNGVHFIDALHGWAVGVNGTAIVMTTTDGGASWTSETVSNQFALNSVWFIDGMRGWAVGNNGSILHTVTGGAP